MSIRNHDSGDSPPRCKLETSDPDYITLTASEPILSRLLSAPARRERITHIEYVPARQAGKAQWPDWVDEMLVSRLRNQGVEGLWEHQVTAAELAHRGQNVIIATGTASGKSLAYLVPAVSEILSGGSVLYLTPTKALAADQLRTVRDLELAQAARRDLRRRHPARGAPGSGGTPTTC